jgi:hypothetical protein
MATKQKLGYDKQFAKDSTKSYHRRQSSANGKFDKIAIKAEKYSDIKYRRASPPNWLLEKIIDCAEKIHNIDIEAYVRSRGRGLNAKELEMAKSAREKALERVWHSYRIVQNSQLLYPGKDTQDESWNNAKKSSDGKSFVSEPIVYLGSTTDLEKFEGWYNHGDRAKGRTTPKLYNDNWDLGGNDED